MKFEKITYPDGQISVKVEPDGNYMRLRINSYEDLITLKSITEAVKHYTPHVNNLQLYIPCLFGQRSDRRFADNQSFDLKIICDIINSCELSRVEVLDPHSDVALALINNSYKASSFQYVQSTIWEIQKSWKLDGLATAESEMRKDFVLIAPDAGAYKKVFEYGVRLNLPVMAGVKHRDQAGKVDLVFTGPVTGKTCIIVDDLLDGGYTFVQLAKELRGLGAKQVFLYITHGYFNKGTEELQKYIDKVYCTNSVKDIVGNTFIHQFNVL